MGLSFGHILLVLIVVLVLFGAGKLPGVMGDLGKGLRNFKDGLKGIDDKSASASDKHKAD
ncbi:MAG: twin-arginine translocase TatA/TatE family subunit [Alphaproteobacteria bacterium]|nr:twin-arginine translocase TatA/TatE family subunit [Alphaproteobacteria bacterium]